MPPILSISKPIKHTKLYLRTTPEKSILYNPNLAEDEIHENEAAVILAEALSERGSFVTMNRTSQPQPF
jgi:hypothetical protein